MRARGAHTRIGPTIGMNAIIPIRAARSRGYLTPAMKNPVRDIINSIIAISK